MSSERPSWPKIYKLRWLRRRPRRTSPDNQLQPKSKPLKESLKDRGRSQLSVNQMRREKRRIRMKTGDQLLLNFRKTKSRLEKMLREKRQSRISAVLRTGDVRERNGEDCRKVRVNTNSSHMMIAQALKTTSWPLSQAMKMISDNNNQMHQPSSHSKSSKDSWLQVMSAWLAGSSLLLKRQ